MLWVKFRVGENEESGLLCVRFPPTSLRGTIYKSTLRSDPLILTLRIPPLFQFLFAFASMHKGPLIIRLFVSGRITGMIVLRSQGVVLEVIK